jgi:hypothetical protein
VQTQWRVVHGQRLRVSQVVSGQISRIATHGKPPMPEVKANLVGAPGQRTRLQQGRAVIVALEYAKFSACCSAGFQIHFTRSDFAQQRSLRSARRPYRLSSFGARHLERATRFLDSGSQPSNPGSPGFPALTRVQVRPCGVGLVGFSICPSQYEILTSSAWTERIFQ